MEGAAQNGVRVERDSETTLALIWDGGELGMCLGQLLERQGLRVERVNTINNFVLEPRYVFFFLSNNVENSDWRKNLAFLISAASKNQGKFFLILDNISQELTSEAEKILHDHSWPSATVEIKGKLGFEREKTVEAMGKIVRMAFSSRLEQKTVILGEGVSDVVAREYQYFPTIIEKPVERGGKVQWNDYSHSRSANLEVKHNIKKSDSKKKKGWGRKIFVVLFVILLPFLILGAQVLLGIWSLKQVQVNLLSGKYFEAKASAKAAEDRFQQAGSMTRSFSMVATPLGLGELSEKTYELFHVAELGANTLYRLAGIAPMVVAIPKEIIGGEELLDLNEAGKIMSLEAGAIDQNLGLIEAEWESGNIKYLTKISGLFGISEKKLESAFGKIGSYRQMIRNAEAALLVLPEVTGEAGRKTYLVVFQNSAELRPTGGFIGSYAIVHFDGGKLLDYKINDIYSADGQLKGRVQPPDEIMHYLGQPNWFMRDANFAADFPLTAKRLEWFLEKETGETVDGVIAVNLGAVQKILEATGGVTVSGQKEKITADNFFHKAEYASEINFFPGSTQKRDFLGQVGEVLLSQITGNDKNTDWLALGQGLQSSLLQKDILFYFNSSAVQNIVETGSWDGGIRSGNCKSPNHNCLMIVQSNFGANKSNYFVKQSLEERFIIGKAGGIVNRVTLNIRNESPSESWPGGTYKNYIRFLAPIGTKFLNMNLGDGRKASLSEVLTEQVLAKLPKNQFLVLGNLEGAVVNGVATTSGYASFGTLVETPIQSNSTITLDMELPNKLDFSKKEQSFGVNLLKQPGNNIDALDVTVEFPSFLVASPDRSGQLIPIASEQRLGYNSDFSVDRSVRINFKQNNL